MLGFGFELSVELWGIRGGASDWRGFFGLGAQAFFFEVWDWVGPHFRWGVASFSFVYFVLLIGYVIPFCWSMFSSPFS